MTTTINGTTGITLPSGSAAVGTTDSQTLTNKTIGSGYAGSTVTAGTAVASTSGTSIDFTSIPSWVKRITVMFAGVSTSGSSNYLVQIGSGSYTSSGYINYGMVFGSTGGTGAGYTNGFNTKGPGASDASSGSIVITLLTANTWTAFGMIGAGANTTGYLTAGSVALSGTLDRIRVTTANGTDTFDAGSINILYE